MASDDLSLVDSLPYDDTGTSVVWQISAPEGARFRLEVEEADRLGGFLGWGAWILDAHTQQQVDNVWTFVGGDGAEVHVQSRGEKPIHADGKGLLEAAFPTLKTGKDLFCSSGVVECGANHVSWAWSPAGPSTFLLVTYATSDAPAWGRINFYADPSVEWERSFVGRSFFHRESSFEGKTNVNAVAFGPLAKVTVMEDVEVMENTEHSLFAVFLGLSPHGALRMGYEGPESAGEGETLYELAGEPAGTYRFRVDENVEYGLQFVEPWGSVFLAGASVKLQWP